MGNSVAAGAGVAARRGSLASATAILMVGFVLSRVLGLVRVSLQAAVLGGHGHVADAFNAAITVPDLVFTLVSGGALASSFIPVFAGLLETGDERTAWRVASGVLNGVLLVIVAAIVVAEVLAPWIVAVKPADHDLAVTLTRIMLLQPLFLTLSAVLSGVYNAYGRFLIPALAPLLYNVGNIAGLLVVKPLGDAIPLAAWGVAIGALLQCAVLLPGLRVFGQHLALGVGLAEAGTREVGRLMIPRVIGQAGIQISTIVAVALANLALHEGPSGDFRYTVNLMALPVGLLGSALATAAFPTLSALAARGDLAAMARTVTQALRTMLFCALPAAVGLLILRYPITIVLFQHGSFEAHDTDLVAAGLVPWAVGLPALIAVELLPRVFFALKDTWTPVLVNLVTLALAIVLSIVGVVLAHGDSLAGLIVLTGAIAATVGVEVVWLALILRHRLPGLALRGLAWTALRALVASEAMGVALLALLYLWGRFGPGGAVGDLLLLLVALPLGLVVYVGWAYVVEAPELGLAREMVVGRLRRRVSAGA